MFTTYPSSYSYSPTTNSNAWTLSWTDPEGNPTNHVVDPPIWLMAMRDAGRNQESHSTTDQLPGVPDANNIPTTVDVTTITTNATTLMRYTGKTVDTPCRTFSSSMWPSGTRRRIGVAPL